MRFKVGDKVSWAGVSGIVIDDYKFKHPEAASLLVMFDAPATEQGIPNAKQKATFLYDGRFHHWHKEPSLRAVPSDNPVNNC